MRTVLDKVDGLVFVPAILKSCVTITVHVRRTRSYEAVTTDSRDRHVSLTTDRPGLPEQSAAEGDVVNARADLLVPAGDDYTRTKGVFVLIT
jgi:hypothetical protein